MMAGRAGKGIPKSGAFGEENHGCTLMNTDSNWKWNGSDKGSQPFIPVYLTVIRVYLWFLLRNP
jgi:hypothetical protein